MAEDSSPTPGPSLKRGLNLPLLVLYGLGTTIGAGIYALVGKVAGNAGMHAPFALLLPLETLARGTSLVTLTVFAVVNFALWRLKARDPHPPGAVVYPRWISLCGCAVCAAVFVAEIVRLAGL